MKLSNFKILSTLVLIGIVLTLLTLLFLPLGLTALLKISNLNFTIPFSSMSLRLSLCIYACSVPYVISLFKLKSICKLLSSKNPFDIKISKKFNDISLCAFCETFLFIAATLIYVYVFNLYLYAFTILTVVIVTFVSITAGFLFKVYSGIFKKASQIKEEIDFTF